MASRIRDQHHVTIPQLVTSEPTGRRGRPRKHIDFSTIGGSIGPGHNLSLSTLAKSLKVDRKTLCQNLKDQEIDVSYTNLEANELDNYVLNYYEQYPDSGYQYCHGYLRKQNLRVRRADVYASMARVRPLATLRQDRHAIVRRIYTVK